MTKLFQQVLAGRRIRRICSLRREIWTIGLILQPLDDLIQNGVTTAISWRSFRHRGMFLADPYGVVLPNGEQLILAEHFDYAGAKDRKAKGEIVTAHLMPRTSLDDADFQAVTDFPYHLSYPSLIHEDDRWYMFVESWEAGGIAIFSAPDPTGPWCFHQLALAGIPAVDPTPVKWGDDWYLFCTRQDDKPNSRLHLFGGSSAFGPWTPHPCSPVKDDIGSARPAGPLFQGQDGQLYRPSQDCSKTYGGAVVVQRVDTLTPTSFRETAVRRIDPPRGPWGHGLHTLCAFGDRTLVDGKRWEWSLLEPAERFFRQRRDRLRRSRLHS